MHTYIHMYVRTYIHTYIHTLHYITYIMYVHILHTYVRTYIHGLLVAAAIVCSIRVVCILLLSQIPLSFKKDPILLQYTHSC